MNLPASFASKPGERENLEIQQLFNGKILQSVTGKMKNSAVSCGEEEIVKFVDQSQDKPLNSSYDCRGKVA